MEIEFFLIIVLFIIYCVTFFIEIKVLNRKKIDIFYKENPMLVFMVPFSLILAICALFLSYNLIIDMLSNKQSDLKTFFIWIFSLLFASIAYIVQYIKNRIYAFIPNNKKLKIIKKWTIYDKE